MTWVMRITATTLLVMLCGCDIEERSCISKSSNYWLYCEKEWSCDHGYYRVRCTMNGNGGMSCACFEGDEEIDSFETSGGCDDAVLSDYNVRGMCGLDL